MKIVLSLLTEDQEFQKLQGTIAERAASQAGFGLNVVYAKNNSTLQLEQLYRFVNAAQGSRPLAIIAQPVSDEPFARVARDAVRAGIGCVILNREPAYVQTLRSAHPTIPIAVVTVDQTEIGRIQSRQMQALLPAGGNVLYIQGPPGTSSAEWRLAGTQEMLAGAKIILKVLFGEWTEASGEQAVVSWLRLSISEQFKVDAIAAQNDAMAAGARKAIAARHSEWLLRPFLGCDGLPEGGQRLVNERQLAATIIVPPSAGPAIDLIAAHMRGTPAPARVVLQPKPYPALH